MRHYRCEWLATQQTIWQPPSEKFETLQVRKKSNIFANNLTEVSVEIVEIRKYSLRKFMMCEKT